MANNELLKSLIRSVIKANGNEEITGDILQQTLVAIVDALGKGYQFMGVATPTTDPGTIDQKVFYIVNGKGLYKNFGGININEDGVFLLVYSDTWTKLLVASVADSLADSSVTTPKIADAAVTKEKIEDEAVSSSKLAKGARRPIIFTPDTIEIDEETYQKLLSDNVDVLFKISTEGAHLCTLTYKVDIGDYLVLCFTGFSVENSTISVENSTIEGSYLFAFSVNITKTGPHTCSIDENFTGPFVDFIDEAGHLKKSALNPVLQEIDLTGTDADRKAKLAQFAANWKNLTGSGSLRGSRFVGWVEMSNGESAYVILSFDTESNYSGISVTDTRGRNLKRILVNTSDGSIKSIPLFSHLEAITLNAGSDAVGANKAAIEAYVYNLGNLGVASNGVIIPVIFIDGRQKYFGFLSTGNDTSYCLNGIVSEKPGNAYYNLIADAADGSVYLDEPIVFGRDLSPIEGSLESLATCVNFTETSSSNKSKLDDYLRRVPNATVMHCTYKRLWVGALDKVWAGTLYKINNDWYGLLVNNTNNPADNINIKLSADGVITEGNSAQ